MNLKCFQFVALLLICALIAGCKSAPTDSRPNAAYSPQCVLDQETVQVPLMHDRQYQWRVRVNVDGTSGTFILDTGAPVTLVSPQFARKANLADIADEQTGSARPMKRGKFADIALLRLGDASYAFFYAPITDLDHLSKALGTEIDGILGGNVLNQTPYTIDWGANLLTLTTRVSPAPPGAIPISVRDEHVSLPVMINGQETEFTLDTGAYRTLLSKQDLAKLHIPADKRTEVIAPRIDIHRAEFDVKQTQVRLDSFETGPLLRTNFDVLVWDYSTLGMDVLSPFVLSVDARHGWLSLAPALTTPAP
jgi:predicted aspartyl protease